MNAEIILSILGGLALFLFAVLNLSQIIKNSVGEKAKVWLTQFTKNTFMAILTGTVVTALLDSSSAVIIITIILVNSSVLNLKQAMGVVMGGNIGTTISSQIIAMDVGKYSPMLLVVGLILFMISKTPWVNNTGKIILYFGMLFFGLYTMERAVEPLKDHEMFTHWMEATETPSTGILIGAFVTLMIQSSSATVGMSIILAKKGILGLSGGIAIMMGSELGTCSDTLLATVKGSRNAIKTGIFHLVFNVFSVFLGYIFFDYFLQLIYMFNTPDHIERSVANAHVLFNVFGVLVFVWFIPMFERGLNYILPNKNRASQF